MGRDDERPAGAAGHLPGAADRRRPAQTQPLVVKKHPLRTISDADLQAQFDLASRIRDKVNEANNAVIQIRRIKTQLDGSR